MCQDCDSDYEEPHPDTLIYKETPCCGILFLGDVGEDCTPEGILNFIKENRSNAGLILVATIPSETGLVKTLEGMGFSKMESWYNGNSLNEVTLWGMKWNGKQKAEA